MEDAEQEVGFYFESRGFKEINRDLLCSFQDVGEEVDLEAAEEEVALVVEEEAVDSEVRLIMICFLGSRHWKRYLPLGQSRPKTSTRTDIFRARVLAAEERIIVNLAFIICNS